MTHEKLNTVYPSLLQKVKEVLTAQGIDNVQVEEIRLRITPAIEIFACPPGTEAAYECLALPGGGVSCKLVCKPTS